MPSEVVLERVRAIVAEIFDMPADQITPQSSAQTLEKWDSMGHLMLVLQLEQEFEVQFTPEQTEQMSDVMTIAQMLELQCAA